VKRLLAQGAVLAVPGQRLGARPGSAVDPLGRRPVRGSMGVTDVSTAPALGRLGSRSTTGAGIGGGG
jgi:hypothetical protein